jgi:hypothetical protein
VENFESTRSGRLTTAKTRCLRGSAHQIEFAAPHVWPRDSRLSEYFVDMLLAQLRTATVGESVLQAPRPPLVPATPGRIRVMEVLLSYQQAATTSADPLTLRCSDTNNGLITFTGNALTKPS